MASVNKHNIRQVFAAGSAQKVQALLTAASGQLSSAATLSSQVVNAYGLTTISHTSGLNYDFGLKAPSVGLEKMIAINSASTGVLRIRMATTATTLYPTTANLITATTGSDTFIHLVAISATQWAVISKSTGLTLTGSTLV